MSTSNPQGARYDWWLMSPGDKHKAMTDLVKALEIDQSARRVQWMQFARMYQNQDPSLWSTGLAMQASYNNKASQWSSRNVVKSCIDTATSKIGKIKPRPLFLTEDGNYDQQERAKKLTQFMDGQFDSMNMYQKGAGVFRDAGIFGIGGVKFSVNTELATVDCEKVLMDEITVDEADAVYGNPQSMYHTKYVSRSALMTKFPKKRKEIESVASAFQTIGVRSHSADLIKVYEGYRLPSKPKAKDGWKVIAIDTVTLQEDSWDKSYFPFVFFRWCPRVFGFWGIGIAEELYGTQLEINKLLRNIQLAQSLVAVPRVFVQNGSMVNAKMDNNIGAIVSYTGQAPNFNTPTAMTGEIYNHLKWLVQSAYDQIGVSEMSATGQKPAGLDSAVAMREYEDVTSERFMTIGQAWDQFYLDCSDVTIDLMKDLQELKLDPKVKASEGDFIETIKWKDVDMERDKYTLRCFSANLLPTAPGARLAKIQELIQGGMIPIDEGMRLLDFPDFKAYRNQALASFDLAAKMISKCLKGQYIAPEPQMNLAQAASMAQNQYLLAKLNNVSPKGLACLSRWLEAVKALIPAAPVAVTPMAPMEGGPTQAVPEAPPTNELLPY